MNSEDRRKFGVCFLSGASYADPLDTGIEEKFRRLAERADVRVVGFATGLSPRRFARHADFYLLPNLRIPVLRYAVMAAVAPLLAAWLIFRHRTNIIVAQSPYEGFAGALAKELALLAGRRTALVVESHGDFEEFIFLHRRVAFPGLLRMLMNHASRFALRRADVLRAVSVATARKLESTVPGKPVFRFPAWTDIQPFLDAFEQNARSNGKPGAGGNRGCFLYCGTISPAKGVHYLVEAFGDITADLPDTTTLVLAGRVSDRAYARRLESIVERHDIQERVAFAGHLGKRELAATMNRAIACVLPTLSEGLPRVVLEAMAAGTAVIATRVGGNPELVRDGTTGFLVPPADREALAEKMLRLSMDPDRAARMGRRGREAVLDLFPGRAAYADSYVESYVRLFREAESVSGESASGSGPEMRGMTNAGNPSTELDAAEAFPDGPEASRGNGAREARG